MSDYTLNIIVNGVDQTGPAQQGMDRLGVGGIAAGKLKACARDPGLRAKIAVKSNDPRVDPIEIGRAHV